MTLATFSSGSSSSSTLDRPNVRRRRTREMPVGSAMTEDATFDQPRQWRQRPVHLRRASQPANNQIVRPQRRVRMTSEDSSSALDELNSSGDEEDRLSQNRLDYLDLSISMPYALVSLRDQLLAYTQQLEERVRSLYPFPLAAASDAQDAQSDGRLPALFYAHVDALKDELRALMNALPSTSAALALPVPQRLSDAVEAARRHSLASDWGKISDTWHSTLAMRPDFLTLPRAAAARQAATADNLPPDVASSPFADLSFASIWSPLASALPNSHSPILLSIQRRFEALQDAVRAMTLRDHLSQADHDGTSPSALLLRRPSISSSQQILSRQLESLVESVKAKGEEVRTIGRARASSIARAAKDAEEHLYNKAVEMARNGQHLIRYENLPELWRNNEFILSGYRFIPKERWTTLVRSTFEIHNETGNIMTHLIGALVVTALFWPSKDQYDDQTTPMDRMVQTIYLIAALKCLVLSVSWHVMAGCSDACLFERFACVDYTGIAWLVAASVWTLVYNAFYCQPNLAMIYSLSTFLVGLVGAIVPWQAWFNDRRNKPLRIAMFLTMCFTGLAPFTHAILSHGFFKTVGFFGAIVPSCMAYVFGLLFYAFQFPECLFPGRFDTWGHAHQIWHISIVVAILLHHRATFFWHQERFNFSCAAVLPETTPLFSNPLAIDLNLADEMVHGWRIIAGRLGNGLVGRLWDRGVDAIMSTF